jgi:uncharacterized membrane protein
MRRFRAVHYLLCFVLLLGVFSCLVANQPALATHESGNGSFLLSPNQEQPPSEEKLELGCLYPVMRDISGESFEFEVELEWQGSESKTFDLATTAPPKWVATVLRAYEDIEAPAIKLEAGKTLSTKVRVRLAPISGELPEPGEYVVTLEVSSGDIREAIELTAEVTALYRFAFYTASGQLDTEVTAGKDNHLSLKVLNTGTAAIEKISLVSNEPSGWSVTFNPDDIEALEPLMVQEVDVVISPPGKTIPGDYMLTMTATSKDLPSHKLEIRVTTLKPAIWGWVAILIVVVVVAGLGVIFRRLGRR